MSLLPITQAEALPEEISGSLLYIADAALGAAARRIAEELESRGYPITGDMDPMSLETLHEAFSDLVRSLALNSEAVAALNDPDAPSVWQTDEVYEPSSLRWVEGLTSLAMRRDPTSFAGFSATVRGSRAAIREFMETHWGNAMQNEALETWLADIRPDSEASEAPSNRPDDKYDAAYSRGYNDGLQGRAANYPLEDDANVNYRDGYRDGSFKREAEREDAAEQEGA